MPSGVMQFTSAAHRAAVTLEIASKDYNENLILANLADDFFSLYCGPKEVYCTEISYKDFNIKMKVLFFFL